MHSAFSQTPLELLHRRLKVRSIVLVGLATNNCIATTAADARMRGLDVVIAADACAARTRTEHNQALRQIRMMGAEVRVGASVPFRA